MANYPNPNISEPSWEAFREVADRLNMRSASSVIDKIGRLLAGVIGIHNKEGSSNDSQ